MNYEPLFDLSIKLGKLTTVKMSTDGEHRKVVIDGGQFNGPNLSGEVVLGEDKQLLRPNGVLEIDARYDLREAGGSRIYVTNKGLRHGSPEVLARIASGEDVDPSEYYFRTIMRFETVGKDLDWLSRSIGIAKAKRSGGDVIFVVSSLL